MRKLILITLLASVVLPTLALETYLTMENDTFLKRADDDYSHGTKFEVIDSNRVHLMIEQNLYAPGDLRKEEHIKGDRPYCGMLIGGIGYEFFQDPQSPWTHYGEIDFGMIGPSAHGKETQKFVHKILHCKDPKGWDNQLHDEFVVNGQWWTKYNYYITDWMALVPRVGIAAGTIQDMTEVGCDLKIGYNLRPTPNNSIMFSAPAYGWQKKLSCWVFVGADERFYLYNHILEGSMFGHKDDGLDVDINRFVGEIRAGAVLRYDSFYVSYVAVFRQEEFKHQGRSPNYGSICVGWTW